MRYYEIRCPVHGFIQINEWERDIINTPVFQRLRRIRQLGMTDYLYPGAVHTRFEHSLGVMHIATRIYDTIRTRCEEVLKSELGYDNAGLDRHRLIVRLAALLHDVGHCPFSHSGENLFPKNRTHESYSAQIIREKLVEMIEKHPVGEQFGVRADEVASLIDGKIPNPRLLFWRELISGQMDADRMDYLLRDSLHLGVAYGRYDIDRLINTIQAIPGTHEEQDRNLALRLGVEEGGWHALESLVLARYYMFTQVYFHPTRMAYDYHIENIISHALEGNPFPEDLDEYLLWDDWRIWGMMASGQGGDDAEAILSRRHIRAVLWTAEPYTPEEANRLLSASDRLAKSGIWFHTVSADKSWYKIDLHDIPIQTVYLCRSL